MCGGGSGVPCALAQLLQRQVAALTARVEALEPAVEDDE